ncbi:MAG: ribose 5-phosphate isomerase B [Actinomycetes bacterium]|jgi:ribose 5-phosphate isomerase B|nr:ribose 5-phosphate isomerase B [Actinomycetes bacterium]
MNIALGSDHAGYEQKEKIYTLLQELGHTVRDYGCMTDAEPVDYPTIGDLVSKALYAGAFDRAILVCGTGLGMAIVANRLDGLRAVPVTTVEFAHLARQHNDANILCLSGRFVDWETNKAIVEEFLNTEFEGGRHAVRVAMIDGEIPPDILAKNGCACG